jgi:hypothetical protein
MSQYSITVTTEYKYTVDANNEHEAISIYINDHDSCIPTNHGNLIIKADVITSSLNEKNNE